jgi:hypothetical protein
VRFLWAKELTVKYIHKEMFPVYGEVFCCVKWFASGSRNYHLGGKHFADDEVIEVKV